MKTHDATVTISLEKYIEMRIELRDIWIKECGKKRLQDGK